MVLKPDAWTLADKTAAEIPPYLNDDDLTVERFYEKHKGNMTLVEARHMLDRLAADGGPLEKQARRKRGGRGGAHIVVYVLKGSK